MPIHRYQQFGEGQKMRAYGYMNNGSHRYNPVFNPTTSELINIVIRMIQMGVQPNKAINDVSRAYAADSEGLTAALLHLYPELIQKGE